MQANMSPPVRYDPTVSGWSDYGEPRVTPSGLDHADLGNCPVGKAVFPQRFTGTGAYSPPLRSSPPVGEPKEAPRWTFWRNASVCEEVFTRGIMLEF